MSFDIFDYSATLADLDTMISALGVRLYHATRRKLDIAGMNDAERRILSADKVRMESDIADVTRAMNDLEDAKVKINALCNLRSEEKTQLIIAYHEMQREVRDFIAYLPFCYEAILTEVREGTLLQNLSKYKNVHVPKYYKIKN